MTGIFAVTAGTIASVGAHMHLIRCIHVSQCLPTFQYYSYAIFTMVPLNLYEAIFNASPTGNYLLSATPDAIILAVNDSFLKASARRREDLVGVSLFVAFPGNPDDPDDTGEVALRESLARVIATGRPETMPAQRYPISVEMPDGEVRYEERFWSAVSTPVMGDDGKIFCISHSTTDITDQVRSEAWLRESEKRFRALVNVKTDVVYRMTPGWTHMHQLDGRGFLKDTTSLDEYQMHDYVHPEDLRQVRLAVDEAMQGKTVFEAEHRCIRADGSHGWAYSRAVPILDPEGNIQEWIGSVSDITERKLVEEQLMDASLRKDEFLAMLAHELRNPLAPIKAAAQLLQLRVLDQDSLRHTSQIIERQVGHMTNLVDELLDVSRVSRNLITLDRSPLDIRQVVGEAVEQSTPLMSYRHHHLEIEPGPTIAFVVGDKKRLVQIIANLLNNAAKFTPDGGKLRLTTDVLDTQVRIQIIDNGIGMTSDTVNHAFELFSQAKRSSDRSSGGLGLGLALVKSLVELHGGSVCCESAGLGKGSKFTVLLPRLLAYDNVESLQNNHAILGEQSTGLRIMVVDDNEDAAGVLVMLLEAMGHEALAVHGSKQALDQARRYSPQVFLLDIGLPGMDGNELAMHLRADSQTADAMLIATTGYGQASDRNKSMAAGFDHHLVKPIDMEKLSFILADIDL